MFVLQDDLWWHKVVEDIKKEFASHSVGEVKNQ